MILNFQSPIDGVSLTIEDNGKAGYAYVKKSGEIVGDVWLFNCDIVGDQDEWADPQNMPFRNIDGYMDAEKGIIPNLAENDVNVNWENDEDGLYAYIYLLNDLYGVVGVGDKPGYARYAIQSGPLAQRMEVDETQ